MNAHPPRQLFSSDASALRSIAALPDPRALAIDDFGHRILDGNGNLAWAGKGHAVITHSENGNRVLKYSAKGLDNSTRKAAHLDIGNTGYRCNTCGVITTNWRTMISRSSKAQLPSGIASETQRWGLSPPSPVYHAPERQLAHCATHQRPAGRTPARYNVLRIERVSPNYSCQGV
jgi:hypothetical protein